MNPQSAQALPPHNAGDLIERLPMPVALLDPAGGVVWSNLRFGELFEAGSFVPPDFAGCGGAARQVILKSRGGTEIAALAHCLEAARYRMLVLDETPEALDAPTLRRLHARLAELERQAMHDRLTGAWNRRYLEHAMAVELNRSRRYRQPLSVGLLDLDHFKRINDRFGHQAGDAVLVELVARARCCMRGADALIRWGGEEFLVLMPYTNHRAAAGAAEKLRAAVAAHAFATVGPVTLSAGVAELLPGEDPEALVARADSALYRAKEEGRDRVVAEARGASDTWKLEDQASLVELPWRESYECGQPVIDAQHRELFRLANGLINASLRQAEAPAEFQAALERCLEHVARHFADEESILAERGYAKLAQHQQAHRMLLERAAALRQAAREGGATAGVLVQFLAQEVVAQHLLAADRDFFPLFAR